MLGDVQSEDRANRDIAYVVRLKMESKASHGFSVLSRGFFGDGYEFSILSQ
jgi:hypothetical protein